MKFALLVSRGQHREHEEFKFPKGMFERVPHTYLNFITEIVALNLDHEINLF